MIYIALLFLLEINFEGSELLIPAINIPDAHLSNETTLTLLIDTVCNLSGAILTLLIDTECGLAETTLIDWHSM